MIFGKKKVRAVASVQSSMAIEVAEALDDRKSLVQMYQFGYLDGWCKANNLRLNRSGRNGQKRETKIWERISSKAEERFMWRFQRKIGRNIKKIRGLQK